jgi:hypothetical protein
VAKRWFDSLRPLCKQACLDAGSPYAPDVVLFYLARWCQKKARQAEPGLDGFEEAVFREAADRIVRNLADDGVRVMRLAAGDAAELSRLKRLLLASARPRAAEAAPDYAEEALQRIMIVLLTGTPPARAAHELEQGPEGPRNEYVFHAPFEFWARRVVINLVIDESRRAAREREGPAPAAMRHDPQPLDRPLLIAAHEALPGMVDAIRRLPDAQRSAMVLSLSRPEVDDLVRERLHELAPDLFPHPSEGSPRSDAEIAERLDSTPRRITANRSLARRKLAERDARWELLLDHLLPHASTRPLRPQHALVADRERASEESNG